MYTVCAYMCIVHAKLFIEPKTMYNAMADMFEAVKGKMEETTGEKI